MISLSSAPVSVIIPCYNQAHFLAEAIESVLAQSYRQVEIIVVDDGSRDHTAKVANSYPGVCYFYQDNRGLAAARNSGLQQSRGDYLVFLDADDRLLPEALECGLAYLTRHPECAFVSGHYRRIAADGTVLATWREQRQGCDHAFISGDFRLIGPDGSILDTWKRQRLVTDHYAALLQRNYISMHATVMYRRAQLEQIGGFDPSLPACEDYDVYLRLARQFPIACHDHVIADYRQHGNNMTRNSALMLASALRVLHAQWKYVQGNAVYEQAYKLGEKEWQDFYFMQALGETRGHLQSLALTKAFRAARMPIRYMLMRAKETALKTGGMTWYQLNAGWNRLTGLPIGQVKFGDLRQAAPIGRKPGYILTHPIDRYYLERFLEACAGDIQGQILLAGDSASLLQGSGRSRSNALTAVNPNVIVWIDLTPADHEPAGSYDCIILVQVLHRVYDLKAALQSIYYLLKPGGVLLVTVPGISQNKWLDSSYWAFTSRSVQRLFAQVFQPANFKVSTYGNVLAITAFLHGLGANELSSEELDHRDPQYQLLIAVRAVKPEDTG